MTRRRILSALRPFSVCVSLLLLTSFSPASAQNENQTTGFSSTHIFDGGYFGENIDTLNGNLTLTIPIGPKYQVNKNLDYQLRLMYNSKTWEFVDDSAAASHARIWGESPFGLGFSLSFGKLYQDQMVSNGAVHEWRWFFVTPDGSKHDMGADISAGHWPYASNDTTFYAPQTRPDPNDGTKTEILITNHTGIRYVLNAHAEIPHYDCTEGLLYGSCNPDWRELNAAFGGYYVSRIEDITTGTPDPQGYYPHYVKVEYDSSKGYGQCISRVSDSTGRVINFQNSWDPATDKRSAKTGQIDLPKFINSEVHPTEEPEPKASYKFYYVGPAPDSLLPTWNPSLPVEMKRGTLRLDEIEIPGGYRIRFAYNSAGELTKRTFPTNESGSWDGPRMEYDPREYAYYRKYYFSGNISSTGVSNKVSGNEMLVPNARSREIREKRLYLLTDPYQQASSTASLAAKWSYTRDAFTDYTNPYKVTLQTTIGSYTNDTIYFFHASLASTNPLKDGKGSSDGYAPEWNDGLNYRTEYWAGSSEGTGRIIRTEETEYSPDVVYAPNNPPPYSQYVFLKDNIRTTKKTITYSDDANKQVVTQYSDWDGYGHWRDTIESGFGMEAPRITRLNYVGKGPRRDVYDYREITDGNVVASRSEYEYDTAGRMVKSIDRKALPALPSTPVSTVLTPLDGDVETTYEYYGGAGGSPECTSPVTGNVCRKSVTSPGTPTGTQQTYSITYHYNQNDSGGYLASKQFAGLAWKSIDWKRDVNTGLIMQACTPSGVCTTYDYDQLGRITSIIPMAPEYATAVRYPNLRKTEVEQSATPNVACGSADDCIYAEYIYDDAVRMIETRKRDYNGGMVAQRIGFDGLGNRLFQSEWSRVRINPNGSSTPVSMAGEDLSDYPKTIYSYQELVSQQMDPFGRICKITPPDPNGNEKETRTVYHGEDTTVTVEGVAGSGGDFEQTTTYAKDALGRLAEVSFPSGRYSGGSSVPVDAVMAEYAYDMNDNLVGVNLVAPDGTEQPRSFSYDGLNRLVRENNPENGVTLYERYDSLGNLLQKRDNTGNLFNLTYDAAGRLLQAKKGFTPLSGNTYDQPTGGADLFGYSAGKLTTTQSYSDTGVLQVTQKFYYSGMNGRPSGESTIIAEAPSGGGLKTSYYYSNFGLRSRMIYPDEGLGRVPLDLTLTHQNGFQTALMDSAPGGTIHASNIQYNPAGGIWKITLPGGSTDVIEPDNRNRPLSITVDGSIPGIGSTTLFSSGGYAYDGAGNVKAIGPNNYKYDPANRLIEALETSNEHNTLYNLTYAYDPFGNLSQSTRKINGDPDTLLTRTYSVLGNNQLNQMVETPEGPTRTFQYDGRGNTTVDGEHAYYYDFRNQLVGIDAYISSQPIPQGTFVYDSAGRRATKTVSDAAVYYARDQEGQVLSEFRRPASSSAPAAWDRDYLYAAGRLIGEAENDNPDPPSGLRSTKAFNGTTYDVLLNWNASPDQDLQGYNIYRCKLVLPSTCSYTLAGTGPAISFQHTPGFQSSTHRYKVTALDTAGHESEPSQIISIVPSDTTLPSAPGILTTMAGDRSVTVTWNPSTDDVSILGYRVWRYTGNPPDPPVCEGTSCLVSPVILVRGTSFVDLGLVNGKDYQYRISAVDTAGNESSQSISTTVRPADNIPPRPPQGLSVIPGCTPGDANKVFISWDPNPPEDQVAYYMLYRNGAAVSTQLTGYTYEYTLPTGVTEGTYTLRARDNVNNVSQASPGVSVTLRLLDGTLDTGITQSQVLLGKGLTAESHDGEVTLRWMGPQCVGGPPCKSFSVYRKPNMEHDCKAYRKVGSVTLYGNYATMPYSVTDSSAENAIAYDYALTLADVSGREGGFSVSGLAVPLENVKDVRRCRGTFGTATCPGPSCSQFPCTEWTYRWNTPQTPTYQPATASIESGPKGYLKGFKIYSYDADSGGSLKWLKGAFDYDYGLWDGKDNEVSYTDVAGDDQCQVITGVYKVFVNGNWVSLESGWSNNFYGEQGSDRCPTMNSSNWCSMPPCSDLNVSPAAPESISAVSGPGPKQITVTWTPPSGANADIVGYNLYVNDPLWNEDPMLGRRAALFRSNHPYLRVNAQTTSVMISGLKACRSYSFYVVAINGAGRNSEPSPTSTQVVAMADPPNSARVPTGFRPRLWTGNDDTFASSDAPTSSTEIARLMLDKSCWDWTTVESSTDPVNPNSWVPFNPGTSPIDLELAQWGVWEKSFPLSMGQKTYYRMVDTYGGQTKTSPPVAIDVLAHDQPPLSPPTHFDALYVAGPDPSDPSNDKVKLHWCPNFLSDQVTGYRIFRSTTSGGPYGAIVDVLPSAYTWEDTDSAIRGQYSNPSIIRYYYVIAAMRDSLVSAYSPENGAGVFLGSIKWDPDTAKGTLTPFITHTPPNADEMFTYCDNDYVENRPAVGNQLSGQEPQDPAPYRPVGILVIPSHFTYYHLDHLGTPRILTDSSGVRVQGQHFLPFGEEMPAEMGQNTRKFTGHERDSETGLDYMMARYYNAELGRFLAVDPASESVHSMNPQTWNRYSYVLNNPLIFTDPTGEVLRFKGNQSALNKLLKTVNKNLNGQQLKIAKGGKASLVATQASGKVTSEQAALGKMLSDVIGHSKTTTIGVVESTSSTPIGNDSKGTIDIDDVNKFGDKNPASTGAVIGHEVAEQFLIQGRNATDASAHAAASKMEGQFSGWTRGPDPPPLLAGPGGVTGSTTIPYTQGSSSASVTIDFKGGNVVNVTKK